MDMKDISNSIKFHMACGVAAREGWIAALGEEGFEAALESGLVVAAGMVRGRGDTEKQGYRFCRVPDGDDYV